MIAVANTAFVLLAVAGGCGEHPAKPRPEPQPVVDSPTALVAELGEAYRTRDYSRYAALFPDGSSEPEFRFLISEPLPSGETSWGLADELIIHERMFDPGHLPPGEPAVNDSLWVASITIQLSPRNDWVERKDLYSSPGHASGLDPERWKVVGAEWRAAIFWETRGNTDYKVDDRSYFYVIEDLSKATGDDRKFLLYRWEDLGNPFPRRSLATDPLPLGPTVESSTWSAVKRLYR